jgi:hypothetical protein
MNNKMPLTSLFNKEQLETFITINIALQALKGDDMPKPLREIAEQALLAMIQESFDPKDFN